jgi:hypothetical protein
MKPTGFTSFAYDTEEIIVGYFKKTADETFVRPVSLFTFSKDSNRSSVWAFPRGSPYRNPSAPKGSGLLIKSVWNIDMLLSFFQTCLQRGDTIVDLFAGTASATIVCTLLGCNSIVVDVNPEHLHLCKTRITAHQNRMEKQKKRFHDLKEEQKTDISISEVIPYSPILF